MLPSEYFLNVPLFEYLRNYLPSIDGEIAQLFFETTGQNNSDP